MAFDFKKEYKALYLPTTQPAIVQVPAAGYLAVRGTGDPNQEGGPYQKAIGILYAVAYTITMSDKTDRQIPGFFPYVVPPLEGFWWQEGVQGIDYSNKSALQWISVIRLPDFVSPADVRWAVETASRKKKLDCSPVEFLSIDEGLCVQCLHLGPYDTEPETIARMNDHLRQQGCEEDLGNGRFHHEIYLSDPRKTPPERWKTVIRHPIRRI